MPQISEKPASELGLSVTIPCRNEPEVLRTLTALQNCDLPRCAVEVLILINDTASDVSSVSAQNVSSFEQIKNFAAQNNTDRLRFFPLYFTKMSKKQSGVGTARKIAMDEAIYRFAQAENPQGIITGLDADTLVQPNYLTTVCDYFDKNPKCPAANIYYEHPTEGENFSPEHYAAIVTYELHLRLYVHALRRAGLPVARQTVGSAMAVRAKDYAAQGGMPRKKAGEDFYFLHKFTQSPHFGEITGTTVIPSPRISDRVPFGTGKAVGDMLSGKTFLTHHPQSYADLQQFLSRVNEWYTDDLEAKERQLPESVRAFLREENFTEKLQEIKTNVSSLPAFRKRFFAWFDAFRAMKYVHFVRDNFYPDLPVGEAAAQWLGVAEGQSEKQLLRLFREADKKRRSMKI